SPTALAARRGGACSRTAACRGCCAEREIFSTSSARGHYDVPRMALKVVGAGLGRTGTNSLKLALEELLGGPCYHMFELIAHPQQVPLWEQALRGEQVDWASLFDG